MLFTTLGQHRVFLWMLAAGALAGAWYGAMALLRRLLAAGPLLSLAADVAFGLGAAAIYCLALVSANHGVPRLYTLLAAALGFALFALAAFPAGRRLLFVAKRAINQIIVIFGRFRWIKVIFR